MSRLEAATTRKKSNDTAGYNDVTGSPAGDGLWFGNHVVTITDFRVQHAIGIIKNVYGDDVELKAKSLLCFNSSKKRRL